MSQTKAPFKLHAPNSSADSAVETSADLPAEISGQPAKYFWKDVIHTGNYVHPNRNFSLAVDRDRLRAWAETGQHMLAVGLAIPINCDHSDAARDVVGYVKEFRLDDDRLLTLCQFIGDEAALVAARNLVSVGIDPDFVDGEARKWGEAVVHLALTPVPVVPDQDRFVLAEGGEIPNAEGQMPNEGDRAMVSCRVELLAKLLDLLGEGADAENCIERAIDRLSSDDEGDLPDLQAELAEARQQIFQLSTRVPPVIPREVQRAVCESATAKFDTAVERGALSPATRDRLVELLVGGNDGNANLIALSRGSGASGDRSLALSIADILIDNQAIATGESTGLQAMPRQVPGENGASIDQLREYMTKVASVSAT